MAVAVVVLFIFSEAFAQDQALSTASPQSPPMPFLDLFTGASNYYPDIRKTYSDPSYYHGSCQKTDALSSLASVLGSAAKIMLSATVIAILKLLGAKLLFLPLSVMVFAKLGLKAILMWPVISKMIKYFKKKKKKSKSRIIMDCSERLACVIQRSYKSSWGSNFGAAVTFSLIEDVDEDSNIAKILLSILAGDKVAKCMSLDCNAGIDIS
ncbi:uncharacterized protein LOC126969606 [Leptidea sinapis]|uniref:Uncharacterized protein n=1 Tax=Leptidea sinapis TaxID=189913 RepID=A0A5E4QH62_9NEOP|nr:uncharacterized protein LOC126969606 [Leptidea sinapis]VVC97626.1 unnamed protein product [Leptidea sinapis]